MTEWGVWFEIGECNLTDRWKTVIKKDDLFRQLAVSSFRLFSRSTTGNTTVGESTLFQGLGRATAAERFWSNRHKQSSNQTSLSLKTTISNWGGGGCGNTECWTRCNINCFQAVRSSLISPVIRIIRSQSSSLCRLRRHEGKLLWQHSDANVTQLRFDRLFRGGGEEGYCTSECCRCLWSGIRWMQGYTGKEG